MGKRKMPKETWELIYDVTSAGEAEIIRLLFEAAGVKYSNVKLGPSEIQHYSNTKNNSQEEDLESYAESSKINKGSANKDIGHKQGRPRTVKRKQRKGTSLSDSNDLNLTGPSSSSISGNETGTKRQDGQPARKKARLQIDGGTLPYLRLPVIRKDGMEVSHVVSILRYLAELYGLCPESLEDRLLAEQIVQYCWDYWTEARFVNAGNAITKDDPPMPQGRQTYVDVFTKERLPIWFSFFEACLRKTMGGKKFLFGKTLCYADLALYHILTTTVHHYPSKVTFAPLLKQYRVLVGSASCVRTYIRSDRYSLSGYFFTSNYVP